MATAYLGIGSNQDPERHIVLAIGWLQNTFIDAAFSPFYRSRSVGFRGADFINLVARIETHAPLLDLKELLNAFEDSHGRRRDVPKFSDRTLDIDILLYDEIQLESPDLTLPRPETFRFAHVLKPLADLAPEIEIPGADKTAGELWDAFPAPDDTLVRVNLADW